MYILGSFRYDLTRCLKYNSRVNFTYIGSDSKRTFTKIGYYCLSCNLHYDYNIKLYTQNKTCMHFWIIVRKLKKPKMDLFC